jgi:acyl-[acyl-carrier-protein]-phospholipid O-acyltransferase / long-chain-fatty-acid--[acyl-carrier-protein] ligase
MSDTTYDKSNYQKGYWSLTATLFQGAFSDNLFKWVLVFLLWKSVPENDTETIAKIPSYAGMIFAIPFIIFPGFFGALADRVSKQKILEWTKLIEIGVMIAGFIAIINGNPTFLWVVFFLMATQSAMFGPGKYGILPEALPESRLSWGNGIMQMMTMVAIIAGVGASGPIFAYLDKSYSVHYVSFLLIILAIIGWITSKSIFKPPAADPSRTLPINPWAGMGQSFKAYSADRWLWLSVLAYVFFWFAGAIHLANIPTYGKVTLGLDEGQISIMLAVISLGIALGALVTGYISRGKIEVGLIPLGALGMALFCGLLGIPNLSFNLSLVILAGLGFFSGMFNVPLAATIQQRSPSRIRGVIMATTNMLTFIGMFAGSSIMLIMSEMGINPAKIFIAVAVLTLLVCLYICFLLPVFLVRSVLWFFVNTIYRLRIIGPENVPEKGGALLIANHVSFLDALVVLASTDRPIRFIMYKGIYDVWWIRPIAKMMGVIPIQTGSRNEVSNSLQAATDALIAGELVCIFAEGQITRTGQLLPFKKGFERIMKNTDAPIIPIYLDQIWGSIFSFAGNKFFWKIPKTLPYKITIAFGEAMPSTTTAFELRNAVQELGTDTYCLRDTKNPLLLHDLFIKKARRYPWRVAMSDATSGTLNNFKALVGTLILGKKLQDLLDEDEEMVGVLLPQSVGATLVNLALTMMGKVVINLNYSTSDEALEHAADICEMRHVITANKFLEKVPITPPRDTILMDDIMPSVTKENRKSAILKALFMPRKKLIESVGGNPNADIDTLATIVFSSGSEGTPKGVMLSHYNLTKNIESCMQVFPISKGGDCVMGMLPFFHVLGSMGTLWYPMTQPNVRVTFHPNPTESRVIGKLMANHKVTMLFSTSTLLQGFIRRCPAEQLEALNYVMTGAEKLSPRVRVAFNEKFGVEPLEGYGTTECSPAVSLNLPDFVAPGFYQKGSKHGTIGHPIPGVSVRIQDSETGKILENNQTGLLYVKGPNIMDGYLKEPKRTAKVLKDGWYETGDIAMIDDDGFITITDRLARFSKIAGEMVSHTKVEESLHNVLGMTETLLSVAGVSDEAKGERIVVLHTLSDAQLDDLLARMDESGLPNLWRPKRNSFYRINEIPVLPNGKLDLSTIKSRAAKLAGGLES